MCMLLTINKVKHWILKKEDLQSSYQMKGYTIFTVYLCKTILKVSRLIKKMFITAISH